MSKPKPPREIDPLPATKSAASRKTGWEPPSPQKVRSNERRMGVLLAFCLLGAIGFVAYRKFHDQRNGPPDPKQFLADKRTQSEPDSQEPDSQQSVNKELVSAEEPPPLGFDPPGAETEPLDSPDFAGDTPPPDLLVADSGPPEQSEPEPAAFEMQLGPQTEPETPAGKADPADNFAGDPFENSSAVTAETTDPPEQPEITADTGDPFTGATFADSPPLPSETEEQTTFSSDSDSPFGSPVELGGPEFETETASTELALDTDDPTNVDVPQPEPPAMNLFVGNESVPEQNAEPPSSPEPAALPRGDPADSGAVAQSDPPAMLEPNDPHVLPAMTVNPFAEPDDAAEHLSAEAGESPHDTPFNPFPEESAVTGVEQAPTLDVTIEAESEPPADAPAELAGDRGFESFSEPSAITEVREPRGFGAPPAEQFGGPDVDRNPFAGGRPTANMDRVRRRRPDRNRRRSADHNRRRGHQDPFAPARDVSFAVNEDEVVIHVVQTGDNFWKISRAHYGSGKFFTALVAYNQSRIPDPRRMRPGMKVLVPSRRTLVQQFPQLVSGGRPTPYVAPPTGPPGFSINASGRPQYRVAKGDTLSGIAQRHLGRSSRWRQIYGMNRDQLPDADSLTTGMVLRLPADATQVRMDQGRFGRR